MMRLALSLAVLALAGCGGAKTEAPKPEAAEVKLDPKEEAEAKKAKELADALAKQKPEFDAALAAKDEAKIDDLADAKNGWALLHRAQNYLSSQDFSQQQAGFYDMEAAANLGVAEAQVWVGEHYAYGLQGYPLKPNTGLMMMERAARQGNIDAILKVGLMYEQDTFMQDKKKARAWYEKGVALGSDKAKDALAKLGTPEDFQQ